MSYFMICIINDMILCYSMFWYSLWMFITALVMFFDILNINIIYHYIILYYIILYCIILIYIYNLFYYHEESQIEECILNIYCIYSSSKDSWTLVWSRFLARRTAGQGQLRSHLVDSRSPTISEIVRLYRIYVYLNLSIHQSIYLSIW